MKLISVVGAAPLFAQFATAMQETACDHTTTAITYFADTNCQDIDHEMTQQEQLRMVTNGEGSMLDGTCHDVLDDDAATSHLRGKRVAASSVKFTCTDSTYSEAWYFGESCGRTSLFVDLSATWGECMAIGEVSFMVTR